ncbi:MAG: M23 family metallopeptidase [bacterium]
MGFIKKTFKEIRRNFTIMLIPHNTTVPIRFTFSLSFAAFLFLLWSGLTIWAGYLASRHIDYWRIRAGDKLVRLKVDYFAQEVKRTREMLDEIKEMDSKLRQLLNIKSKQKIIEQGAAAGGPTELDNADLQKLLLGKLSDMTQKDIDRQIEATVNEFQQRMQSYAEITDHINQEHSLYRAVPNIWPTLGHITSRYGNRKSPMNRNIIEFHPGLDLANKKGTPVYATADGIVKLSGWEGGYGKLVVIDHGHGYETRYAHHSKILVAAGDKVTRGQIIGYMGNTGTSTGNHVHYEILLNGKTTNPYPYLSKQKI